MVDTKAIEAKWIKKWEEKKVFEANADDSKEKFFIIFAYPGVSGYLHLGHMRSMSTTDVMARYKRLRGFNVLFPVGTHASGNIAFAFAKKVKNQDEAWLNYLKSNGATDEDIKEMTSPERIVDYFNNSFVDDCWKRFGFSADWRRFTSTIYPDYNKFIQWQFMKLEEKDLLVKKPYFATFCPACGPVAVDPSETDISKGGKAEKNEYTLLKFAIDDYFIVAATLRPETVFGQTNLWLDPDLTYVKAKVDNEVWLLSREAVEKLKYQKDLVEIVGEVSGRSLLGKYVKAPGIDRDIMILPSRFCDPKIGTGIVTSVPSDAPHDYMGLVDLQKNEDLIKSYGLDVSAVQSIKLIPIIKTPGYGPNPAEEICKKLSVKNQDDPKLEDAKKEIYKAGFHTGTMIESAGSYAGMKVFEAKEKIKEDLIEAGKASVMHDLSEEVVCRCGEQVIIKRIDDQWFVRYSDPEVTKQTVEYSKELLVKPEEYKTNLPNVLEWFSDRPCARLGNWLGTKLPQDHKWIIEPISDSTLYPIYYLISMYVNNGSISYENLNEEFFDYVFLDKGTSAEVAKKCNVSDPAILEQIRKDVNYWYPLDINSGGKEHQTVHFPVFLMNHIAILPQKHWPKGIFVNKWLTGKGGGKISKSKGGAEPVGDSAEIYSVDALRLYFMHIGSPHSDVEWDSEIGFKYKSKIEWMYQLLEDTYNNSVKSDLSILDKWLLSELHTCIEKVTLAFDSYNMKNAADIIYFEMYNALLWYKRRQGNNRVVIEKFINSWLKMMVPITPFIAEELNEKIFEETMISVSYWPSEEKYLIDYSLSSGEQMLMSLIEDITEIKKLAKLESLNRVRMFTAASWKHVFFEELQNAITTSRKINEVIPLVLANENLKPYAKLITKMIPRYLKDVSKIPKHVLKPEQEKEVLDSAIEFFKQEFSCEIEIIEELSSKEGKASQAMPNKPAILVE